MKENILEVIFLFSRSPPHPTSFFFCILKHFFFLFCAALFSPLSPSSLILLWFAYFCVCVCVFVCLGSASVSYNFPRKRKKDKTFLYICSPLPTSTDRVCIFLSLCQFHFVKKMCSLPTSLSLPSRLNMIFCQSRYRFVPRDNPYSPSASLISLSYVSRL